MTFAPHLPPPSSSVAWHHKVQRLKIIALATVFGLLSGVSGAAVMLGWIWPAVGEGDTWAITRGPSAGLRGGELEPAARSELGERMVAVYRKAPAFGGTKLTYLNPQDKVGEAAVVSSDGWAVIMPPIFPGAYAEWRAVDKRGTIYRVEKFLEDRRSGLLFVKLAIAGGAEREHEQFKVVSFSAPPGYLEEVFVFNTGTWVRTTALSPRAESRADQHLDSAGFMGLQLAGDFPDGAWAANRQGRLLGFVYKNNLLPAEYVNRLLPQALQGQKITYPTLGAEGWYSAERPIVQSGETIAGFLVTKVVTRPNPLKVGDIVLTLNGQLISSEKIWYTKGEGKAMVKVLRGGKEIEVEVKIVEL